MNVSFNCLTGDQGHELGLCRSFNEKKLSGQNRLFDVFEGMK